MIAGYVLVAVLVFSDGTTPPMFAPPKEMASEAACKLAAADWRNTPPDINHLTGKPIGRMYADCQVMVIDQRNGFFQ